MKYAPIICAVLVSAVAVFAQAPSPAPAAKEAGRTLRFVTDFDSPPFSFVERSKKVGFEIDLGQAIGRELGARVLWIQKGFNLGTYESLLKSGAADAVINSISIAPERQRQFDFTVPYYRSSLAVAAIKDIDWNHTDFINGLKDMRLGVLRRSTSYEWARRNLSAKRVNYYSPQRMAQALRDEQVFCILIDEDILKWVLHNNAYRFQEVERDLDHEYYGIVVKKGNTQLVSELDQALKRLDEKDIYDTIYEKWFTRKMDLPRRPSR
ncbi:MAG: ABC transporter substrate-binding protein [Candidatus Aureabacteria bacterium]|nr:ABC transporter substrate-binding protein [Candidatus Auribacterota bacterium]